jgi:hypothetical protein
MNSPRLLLIPALMFWGVALGCNPTDSIPEQALRGIPDQGTRYGTLWAPHLEWLIPNPSYQGNPFEIIATVSFVHEESGETRETQMFYAGENAWGFRFTGTRTGTWTFQSSSDDSDLDGRFGRVVIEPNPDPTIEGFLKTEGNRFAIQTGEHGELRPRLYNVYMNHGHATSLKDYSLELPALRAEVDQLLDEADAHGMDAVFVAVNNNWFHFGSDAHADHSSENPDLRAFLVLDELIARAHARGLSVHIWKWGDEQRKWTPIGVGGINGIPDRRLQRYIAARLGPLPGWSMSYGFDLHEWVTPEQVASWAEYLQDHLGWSHILMGRQSRRGRLDPDKIFEISDDDVDVTSHDERPQAGFFEWTRLLMAEADQPILFERRFLHTRDGLWDMDRTRRAMWQFTLGGGAGAIWGILWDGGPPYPRPYQLRTHRDFWEGRFLAEMKPSAQRQGPYSMSTPEGTHYVIYQEDAGAIELNLQDMAGARPALAVDTKQPYREITLGTLEPGRHVWTAPYVSDWAVAVGSFP